MSSIGPKTISSACALAFSTTPLLAQSNVSADFDNDGFDDVAIGVPLEDNGTVADCGGVYILYGATPSITATGTDIFFQSTVGLTDEAGDQFGFSLAVGDFDGDGFDDLAVGAALEDLVGPDQGAVVVLFGSSTGLSTTGIQFLTYGSGVPASGDRYGYSLTAANFIGTGAFDELAIGIPYRDVAGHADAGAVEWWRGGVAGLSTPTTLTQNTFDVASVAEAGDRFGFSLTSGNFDDDSDDDLVVGVPYEDSGLIADAGYVHVFDGDAISLPDFQARISNLSGAITLLDTCDATGGVESGDLFGRALAAGDFGGDGDDDLAVGKAHEDVSTELVNAGEVNVHYGTSTGLLTTAGTCFNQDNTNVPGAAETGDFMGFALVTANFNGDAYEDLAIGCPTEDIGAGTNQGYAIVLYGASGALTATGSDALDDTGCDGGTENSDEFGSDLSAGDVNGSGSDDLIISIPFEDVGTVINAGAVNVRYAVIGTNQCWSQDSAGIPGTAESTDCFGRAVAH